MRGPYPIYNSQTGETPFVGFCLWKRAGAHVHKKICSRVGLVDENQDTLAAHNISATAATLVSTCSLGPVSPPAREGVDSLRSKRSSFNSNRF